MSAIKTSLCKTVPGTLFISTALGTEMRRPGDRVTENVSFPLFPSKLTFGSVHVALGDMCRVSYLDFVFRGLLVLGDHKGVWRGKATRGHLGLQEGRRGKAASPPFLKREETGRAREARCWC